MFKEMNYRVSCVLIRPIKHFSIINTSLLCRHISLKKKNFSEEKGDGGIFLRLASNPRTKDGLQRWICP
jgi:hypothetical protein